MILLELDFVYIIIIAQIYIYGELLAVPQAWGRKQKVKGEGRQVQEQAEQHHGYH